MLARYVPSNCEWGGGGVCGWYNDGYPACASAYAVAAGGPLILGAPAPAHPTAATHHTRLTLVHHIGQQHSEVLLLLEDLVIHYLHLIKHTVYLSLSLSLSHTHTHTSHTHTSDSYHKKCKNEMILVHRFLIAKKLVDPRKKRKKNF